MNRSSTPVTVVLGAVLGAGAGWAAFFLFGLRLKARVPGFTDQWVERLLVAGLVLGGLAGAFLGLRSLRGRGLDRSAPGSE